MLNFSEIPMDSNKKIMSVGNKKVVENVEEGGLENVEVNVGILDKNSEERSVIKEHNFSRKRKRECYASMIIKWTQQVAKDPCDPSIGKIPKSKWWSYYGKDHLWKQALLARAMLFKRDTNSSARQSILQNKRMESTLYEFLVERSSPRVLPARDSHIKPRHDLFPQSSCDNNFKDKGSDLSTYSSGINSYPQKIIPIGPCYQAVIPKWDREAGKSDEKWLGNRVWPLETRGQNKCVIDNEQIAKGRQGSCDCQSPGFVECERRKIVHLELGSAFYEWEFDNMGEVVALSWTKKDEKKFIDTLKSYQSSKGKCFKGTLLKAFPEKGWKSLVSYYFNVYLLRYRGCQNRTILSDIDKKYEKPVLRSQFVELPDVVHL